MALPQQLAVSTVPSAGISSLGAIVDCGPNQNGARTFSVDSASLSTGDQVQVLGSNDGFVADSFVLGYLNTSEGTAPGQNTALVSPYTARYLRTYRVSGTAPLTVEAAESSPSAGGGGGGGSTGPLTSMTPFVQPNLATGGNIGTNAVTTVDTYSSFDVDQTTPGQALTFIAPTSTTVDKVEFVSNDGSTSFTMYGQTINVGTFGLVKYNSVSGTYTRPCYASLQGDTGLGFNMALGPLDAHAITINANGNTGLQVLATGATTLGNTTGATTITASAGGISIDCAGAVSIGGASATAITLGNTTAATTNQLKSGNAGVQVGAALLLTATPVSIVDGTGTLGTAAATVDITSRLQVNQTTPIVTQASMRTIAPPTVATAGRLLIVENVGTAPFTVGDATLLQGVNLNPQQACWFEFNGTNWIVLSTAQQDPIQGAALTDAAAASERAGLVTQYTLPAGTLTAPRTDTLSTTAARKGDEMIITRLDVSANTYTVAGAQSFVMPASKINFAIFRYDGAAWQFQSGGTQ